MAARSKSETPALGRGFIELGSGGGILRLYADPPDMTMGHKGRYRMEQEFFAFRDTCRRAPSAGAIAAHDSGDSLAELRLECSAAGLDRHRMRRPHVEPQKPERRQIAGSEQAIEIAIRRVCHWSANKDPCSHQRRANTSSCSHVQLAKAKDASSELK
jgi:hypothetical protein